MDKYAPADAVLTSDKMRPLISFQQLSAEWAASLLVSQPKVVAISGAQGSGKSTLAALLAQALSAQGLSAAVVSLDDYYLGRAERLQLARQVHPLLKTRGVPGTHQIGRLLADLKAQHAGNLLTLPRFCKATDEQLPARPACRVDILILEGWCLGLLPLTQQQLMAQPNALEETADPDGRWRYWVNQQLSGCYQQVWRHCDAIFLLHAPCWQQVCLWREQAEHALFARHGAGMTATTLALFMQHFQRWTLQLLAGHHVPITAGYYLNETHQIYHRS